MGGTVTYERRGALALITLNRPEVANAQDKQLTYELDDAFFTFSQDDDARVAILQGAGNHFSAGHDTTGGSGFDVDRHPVTLWWDHRDKEHGEWIMAFEEEAYLGMCRRWRELPKPTIAAVHGACVGGGLALAWSCDLIVAAGDAFFAPWLLRRRR